MVTSLELMTFSLSSLRKCQPDPTIDAVLQQHISMFNTWWTTLLPILESSTLVSTAVLHCLKKVVKISKLPGQECLRATCCSNLSSDIVQVIRDGGHSMVWRRYLKCCCLILSLGSEGRQIRSKEYTELAKWILSHLSKDLLQ